MSKREQISDTFRTFSFWQDKRTRSVRDFEDKFDELADQILALFPEFPFNPDYLDFKKGVAEGRKLERQSGVNWTKNNLIFQRRDVDGINPEWAISDLEYTKLKEWQGE